jgi:ribosome assembly protein 4
MSRFIANLRGHVAAVYRVAWSADSRMLVSASKDTTLKVSRSFFQSGNH